VPRHFERARAVGEELAAQGVKFVFRDQLAGGRNLPPGEADCLMVNTTGELRHFYAHATVVFVGKSLTAEGGQNPIEPAALGRAMVFGPNMQNFTAIAEEFVAAQGAVQVADAAALQRELAALLAEPARREELGRKGLEVVRRNQGGIERTARLILSRLAKGGSQQ
jgi:3-deoxy-D-manno-octulosonic-acid transferase